MAGGYVTRGRATELERLIAQLEGRLTQRLNELERRLAKAEGMPLELIRRQVVASLELIRDNTTNNDRGNPRRD